MNNAVHKRGTKDDFSHPASRCYFSFHPAAMNIFIPILPGETQVSLVHHQLMDKLEPLQY